MIRIGAVSAGFFLLASLSLIAQQSDGQFAAPGGSREIREVRPAAPGEVLPPRTHGVVVMMSERGLEVISPLAPGSLGRGEKVLTRTISAESGVRQDTVADPPFGGIQLFGWIF